MNSQEPPPCVMVSHHSGKLRFASLNDAENASSLECLVGRLRYNRSNSIECLGSNASKRKKNNPHFSADACKDQNNNTGSDEVRVGNREDFHNDKEYGMYTWTNPIGKNGLVQEWKDFEKVLEYGFDVEFPIEQDSSILMTEKVYSKSQRENLITMMFESFRVERFGIKNLSALRLVGLTGDSKANGLVLDELCVTPVYEGFAVNSSIVEIDPLDDTMDDPCQEWNPPQTEDLGFAYSTSMQSLSPELSTLVQENIYLYYQSNIDTNYRSILEDTVSPYFESAKVYTGRTYDADTFKGAQILAQDDQFLNDIFVTRAEYYESGPSIAWKKLLS
jgi:actin-related protein